MRKALSTSIAFVTLTVMLTACAAAVAPASAPAAEREARATNVPASSAGEEPVTYANPDYLADAQWLREHLGEPELRVVALVSPAEYSRGHIPGAAQIDLPDLEVTDTSEASIERWRAEMETKLGNLGISPGDTVVVYDHGSLYATRLWWILDWLGHEDKRVLNGGLPAWRQAGGDISAERPAATKTAYQGNSQDDRLASWKYVLEHVNDPNTTILDVRSPQEYRGQDTSGTRRGGHIPGALNVGYQLNALSKEPRYFRPPAELLQLYAKAGVMPEQEVIVYCRTGARASVTYFALRLIGYPDVRLYTGSWAEWGNRQDLPIER